MTKLDYQRHEPKLRPVPKPGHTYPVWLGYITILASVLQTLSYLSMVLPYHFNGDETQAQEVAGTFLITIACMCIAWSVYLFYTGTVMTLGEVAPNDARLLVWGSIQVLASILLAAAFACERLSHVIDGSPTTVELTERAASNAVKIGALSAAYAICLLWCELATRTKPIDRLPRRR